MDRVDIYIQKILDVVVNPLLTMLFAVAVLIFLFGMVRFLANMDNEEIKTAGKRHMVFGVAGMAIMVSAYAIVAVIQNTIGIV